MHRFKALNHLEYVTADLNSPWADHHFDCHDIPFEDNSFDALMANHLLEHVADDRRVMSEFVRVLKPGGWAVLQVPINHKDGDTAEDPNVTDPMERERLYWREDHVRLYGHEDYPKRLAEAGFEVEVVDMMDLLGESKYRRYCLGEESARTSYASPSLDGVTVATRVSSNARIVSDRACKRTSNSNEHAMEKSVVAGWGPSV